MKLKNKLAIITGGSDGIGYGVAKLFLQEGAFVTITGRNEEKLNAAKTYFGGNILCLKADVSNPVQMKKMYLSAKNHFNQNIDIIVANAGISQPTPLGETSEDILNKIFSINLAGVFHTVQQSLPYLNNGTSITLVASLAASQGIKNFSVYSASKAGVVSLAKSFAADLLDRKIRVNSVSPGVVKTSIIDGLGMSESELNKWSEMIPMKRIAKVEEIAASVLFLSSDAASYITGANFAIDGGMSGISTL